MHLHRLEVQNFMRLEAFQVDADGKHVIIQGPNGSGKTSAVDAIFVALCSTTKGEHPEPVHRGADKALIKLDLGEYLVEKHFTDSGSRLVVTTKEGNRVSSPQKLLEGLLSRYCLDPVAFLDRRPQDQFDDVLKVCGVEPPVAAVEEIAGEPQPARPGETADQYMARLSADDGEGAGGVYYQRRREAGRQVETYRGAVAKAEELLRQKEAEAPGDVRPVSEILAELGKEEAQQRYYEETERELNDASTEVEALEENMAQVVRERESTLREIARLQAEVATLDGRIAKGKEFIAEATDKLTAAQARLAQVSSRTDRITALRAEVGRSESSQKALHAREQAETQLAGLRDNLTKHQSEHARLDSVLDALRSLRKRLLEGVDLGVEGLEVGQGELRLHGVSFKQASNAQRLRVACAVAMKGNGALKLIRIDDGEHLDSESRRYLLELASQQGYQVVMTCVADREELGVEIVDGAPPALAVESPASNSRTRKTARGKLFDDQKSAVEAGY